MIQGRKPDIYFTMQQVWGFLNQHITYAPLFVFLLLILAGLNLPMSEDLIIITSALLARTHVDLKYSFYVALLAGAILSDHMAYWIGKRIGHGLHRKYFHKFLNPAKLERVHLYIRKYGIFSFIICRFIPFGVRNTLFMSSGIMRMKYGLFSLFDGIAALISVSTLYFLVYRLGSAIERPYKILGILLFGILLIAITLLSYRLYSSWKRSRLDPKDGSDPQDPDPIQ
ncbi:MAG: VTT domain-containing protein [Spirochaetales bacterium]